MKTKRESQKTATTIKLYLIPVLLLIFTPVILNAQNKTTIAVSSVEAQELNMSSSQATDLLRLEIEKTNHYFVIDKYEMLAGMNKMSIVPDSCFTRECLVKVGKSVNAQQVMSGRFNRFGKKIVISLRVIDVTKEQVVQTQVEEFLDLPEYIQEMTSVSIRKMLGIEYSDDLYRKLTLVNDYESELNNPDQNKLVLNGPRMGLSLLTGHAGRRFMDKKENGGYESLPFLYVIGYQHEVQYLNSGKIQALFEFIPVVSGIDKGLFIPGLSVLNGLRHNLNGWEFAMGANFTFLRMAEGYYDDDKKWHFKSQTDPVGIDYQTEIHSKGDVKLRSGFILAVGKSFKSGKLNIPVNAFIIPSSNSMRLGMTFGFNTKKN